MMAAGFLPFPHNILLPSVVVLGLVIWLIALKLEHIGTSRASAYTIAKKQGLSDEEAKAAAKAVKFKSDIEP